MLARELYDRCDEKTRQIIQTYASITYENSDNDGCLNYILEINKQRNTSLMEQYLWNLLAIAIILDNEIQEVIQPLMIEVKGKENFKDEILSESKVNTSDLYKEGAFHQKGYAKLIIFGGIDLYSPIICIERILFNLIKQGHYHKIISENNREIILNKLEKLAQQKESSSNKIITRKNTSSSYRGVGEVLTEKEYLEDPLIGREKEFRKFCAHIMDKEKSVIVYGPPGVGKTTLAKSLAYKIQQGLVPKGLEDRPIIKVEASDLIAGANLVGDVEANMKRFLAEVRKNPNNIVFIDEIHTLMGLGQGSHGNNDVSNILKPALGDGEVKIIGSTTTEEYNIIKNNGAFSRRFLPVELKQLSDEEILHILDVSVGRLKVSEGVNFSFDDSTKNKLLKLILEISKDKYQNRNMEMRYNPDASLTLLRSGYNFCKLDGVKDLTIDYMIEGIEESSLINPQGVEYFKEKVKTYCKK